MLIDKHDFESIHTVARKLQFNQRRLLDGIITMGNPYFLEE